MESDLGDGIFSRDQSGYIKDLFLRKHGILSCEEETIPQKIRAIWLQAGDENTKYFHNYANRRRISNSIWESKDDDVVIVTNQDLIKDRVVSYFSSIYKDPKNSNIDDQLKVLKLFLSMFSEADCALLNRPIDLAEVELTLNAFAKDKIPSPDNWTVKTPNFHKNLKFWDNNKC